MSSTPKYLSFCLGNEVYGIGITNVQEIISLLPITPVPHAPQCIVGVINLRGTVIPVVDLRIRLGLTAAVPGRQSCVVVVSVPEARVGVLVDNVCEVIEIPTDQVDDVPQFGQQAQTSCLCGIGKAAGAVRLILDIERVLAGTGVTDGAAAPGPQAKELVK